MQLRRYLIVFFILFLAVGFSQSTFAQEQRKPVIVPGKTFLPLRVLVRPFSNIYKKADEKSGIVEENVPVFQSYYVYTRPEVSVTETEAEGWYEVGSDNRGTVVGWMKAEDVMEWKQTMCLSYTHPGGRKPVLMFDELKSLRELIKLPTNDRTAKANSYYEQANSYKTNNQAAPKGFPIISMEPKDAIDITEAFYLLPILEYAPIEVEGREGRLLKLASAPKSQRGPNNFKNPEGGGNPEGGKNPEEEINVTKLAIDLVYVVDMTSSMAPYIEKTLDTIKDISLGITQNSELAKSVHFGLWGYRDSTEIPGMEFNTKNFTQELQNVKDFEKTLASVKVAQAGSRDYPEDVFTGVDNAMRKTKWTENALHFMVLIGDAPAHESGNPRNESGQNAETLRTFASDKKYNIISVHIKDKEYGVPFWDLTEQQFRTLSRNRGLEGDSSYFAVDSKDLTTFQNTSKKIVGGLVNIVEEVKKGTLVVASAQGQNSGSSQSGSGGSSVPNTKGDDVSKKIRNLGYAALVDWIGKEKGTQAPRDIIAWVTDKDLIDPSIPSLEVRILINKKELDSLKTVMQEIMSAGRRGIIGGEKFFDALQAVPSAAARGGDQIRNAKSLAETNLVPEFMQDLPYQSKIMSMNNDLWSSWSVDQQEEFLNEIDAKIKLYVAIHDEPKGWVALQKGDDPDEHVYPVSLDALP
jgi:serine/threonine-protein kinase PpkA